MVKELRQWQKRYAQLRGIPGNSAELRAKREEAYERRLRCEVRVDHYIIQEIERNNKRQMAMDFAEKAMRNG
jgi:DNA helicase HerA-like ATPase